MGHAIGETLELIRRSQAGDDEAFGALFHKYKNLVYRTAYLMLGSDSDAEDVLQEVFLEVHRALRTYQPSKGAFTTWLYRITMNDCLNWRRVRRLPAISLDDISMLPGSTEGVWRGLEHDDAVEIDDDVWQAVSRLSPKLRTVVILRYYLELSYAEMTQVLNVPLGTVKSRLNQALQTVRRDLEAQTAQETERANRPGLIAKKS